MIGAQIIACQCTMARPASALLLGVVLCHLLCASHAALMAVDWGSEYLKVCLIKPGRTPIAVVVNEMSKRKSPALVGLVAEDRVSGEEAFSLGVRYPERIFHRVRDLLGRSAQDPAVVALMKEHHLPYTLEDHPQRQTATVKLNETASHLAEELAAAIFQYAKQITEAQAGQPIVDTVVAVPAWFGIAQRRAVIDAASLAGLNVLALINSHSAAALQFGIERDFAKKEQQIILYDMGSGSTEVALIRYSTYSAKEGGRSKPHNQFEVVDVDWDAQLGGNSLDALLAEHFAAAFNAKYPALADVRESTKAMAKLKRQVRRTKEILSANTAAPLSVEELHQGQDFSASITREAFEKLATSFFDRAAAPLARLMERNSLKASDIDAVELLGGGSRVPRLQAALSEALGGRHLDRHLDADEAVVLGAALFAANLSTSFRLRKFGMADKAVFGVQWESEDVAPKDADADAAAATTPGAAVRNLLPFGKKLPIKRAVKFSNLTTDSFGFTLAYNASSPHGLPPGVASPLLGRFEVSGIADVVKRYNSSGTTALRFEADYSGLLELERAESVVEVEVMEERLVEVPQNETAGAADGKGGKAADGKAADSKNGKNGKDAKKGAKDTKSGKGDEKAGKDSKKGSKEQDAGSAASAADANDTAANATEKVFKTIMVPKKRTYKVPLKVGGPGWVHGPLTDELLEVAKKTVAGWLTREGIKRDTAKAKNDLEAYIISTRDQLDSRAALQQVATEKQRQEFSEQLMDAEDWLYSEGEHEAGPGFRSKLAALKAVGDPIMARAQEHELRPEVVSGAKQVLTLRLEEANAWESSKPWIHANESAPVIELIKEAQEWLAKQEAAQAKKADHEDPAFNVRDVAAKLEVMERSFIRVNSKRKPKPPPAPKTNATSNGTDGQTANGTAEDASSRDSDAADSAGSSSGGAGASGSEQSGQAGTQQQASDEDDIKHEEL